jgi:sugar O-acyltransferase (sialic acid O-acetyltransferase NeuD family)
MIIVGASNLGLETMAILLKDNYPNSIIFYDTNSQKKGMLFNKFPVITDENELLQYMQNDKEFVVAIGHPRYRERMYKKLLELGGTPVNVISSSAYIFPFNKPFVGCIVEPGAGISHSTEIGEGCAIHINCTIGHAVKIGKFVNIGPGANIVGPCEIDDFAYISVGAIVHPGVKIGKYAFIGSNKVVTHNINDYETLV